MMNKRMFLVLVALTILMVVAQSGYAATKVDTERSSVKWLGTKVTGQHDGSIQLKSGSLETSGEKITGAKLVMDMSSILVLDIEDPKWNKKLEDHLKNDDFFAVDKYPEAIFELSSLESLKPSGGTTEPNYRAYGDLTIKGITHALSFDVRIDEKGDRYTASGTMVVDRTKYDIRYKSGKFFENLGDRTIHDDFQISFQLVTK